MVPSSICQSCGACCASFRVSFHWSEADPALGGTVPPDLVEPAGFHFVSMRGTSVPGGRCECLRGELGREVSCSIYDARSSTCRDFGEDPVRCDAARAAHGLPSLGLLPPA
jgi:Fe-S-cluster containining protein